MDVCPEKKQRINCSPSQEGERFFIPLAFDRTNNKGVNFHKQHPELSPEVCRVQRLLWPRVWFTQVYDLT